MKRITHGFRPLTLAALAICLGSLSFGTPAEESKPDSEAVSKLLSDARIRAAVLRDDASKMESYTRSSASWESHSAAVNIMRDHINEAGRQLTELQNARDEASPWQLVAIDRIHPMLKELAGNTGAMIRFINQNPRRLFLEEYKNYIEANSDLSSELASMISDFLNYGETKQRLASLSDKLELETLTQE